MAPVRLAPPTDDTGAGDSVMFPAPCEGEAAWLLREWLPDPRDEREEEETVLLSPPLAVEPKELLATSGEGEAGRVAVGLEDAVGEEPSSACVRACGVRCSSSSKLALITGRGGHSRSPCSHRDQSTS